MKRGWTVVLAVFVAFTGACASNDGSPSGGGRRDGGAADAGVECTTDEDCEDDGIYCNGTVACVEGQCRAEGIPTCNDGVGCTLDECLMTTDACQNTPVDSACPKGNVCVAGSGCGTAPACEFDSDCTSDGVFCNGDEVCVEARCMGPGMRSCDDTDSCTADECVETASACNNVAYDHLTDPMHCGATGMNDCAPCPAATAPHMEATCTGGVCAIDCAPGFWDVDGDPATGCEVECATDPILTPDVPDDMFLDQNCDGIDGTVAHGVFVAEDGSNSNPGTRDFPLRTITRAIEIARSMGKEFVYVAAGTYVEAVTVVGGVGLHGGYLRASAWRRDGTHATISGPRTGGLIATDVAMPTTVEYIDITSANSAMPGRSSQAVVVTRSTGLVLRHLEIRAGAGADGTSGASGGATGDDGGRGADGYNGYEDDGYFYCAGDSTDPAAFQAGGDSCIGGATRGGNGGRGCKTNGSACAGANGDVGASDGAAPGGRGTGVAGGAGGSGTRGDPGGPGVSGAGGSLAAVVGGELVSGAGAAGARGQNGGGGGGAAGGGSNHSSGTCNDWGGGGGSGGGGGCGGGGGDGGLGGGSSVGALLIGFSSVTVEVVTVVSGDGGTGGAGRDGGPGGPGGVGGNAGVGYDESRAGGSGGNGGAGGRGGHGGGGAGGSTFGAFVTSGSTWSDGGSTMVTLGTPGAGGASAGNRGSAGVSAEIYRE